MRTGSAIVLFFAVFLSAALSHAQLGENSDRFRIRLNYWIADYTGDIKLEDADVLGVTQVSLGESLELEDELGLENPQNLPEVEAQVRLGRNHRIILSYFAADYSGDERLDTNIEFAGYTFQANTDLESEFKFSRLALMHAWSPLNTDRGSVSLLWGAHYYWWTVGYEGTEVNSGIGVDESESVNFPVPVVGIEGDITIWRGLGAYANFSGIGIAYEDIEASYTELNAGLYYKWNFLYAGAGYRSVNTKLFYEEDGSDDLEIDFDILHQGFMISLGAQF